MRVYFISKSGRTPKQTTMQSILDRVVIDLGREDVEWSCRKGPSVNNVKSLYEELSALRYTEWEIVYMPETNEIDAALLNPSEKDIFYHMIQDPDELRTTGMILKAIFH